MPNTKSAIKALRQNRRRRSINVARRRTLREVINNYNKTLGKGDRAAAVVKLNEAYKKLDKAAKVSLIKKNKAARIKSRLAKKLNK